MSIFPFCGPGRVRALQCGDSLSDRPTQVELNTGVLLEFDRGGVDPCCAVF